MNKDPYGPAESREEHAFIDVTAEMVDHVDEPSPRGFAGWLTWVTDGLAGLVVLAITAIVTATVIFRALNIPLIGAVEVASLLLVVMTLLAAPGLAKRDEHVKVELSNGLGGLRTQRVIDLIALALQIIVTVILLYGTAVLFLSDLQHPVTVAGELRWPRYLVTAVLPLSFLIMLTILVPKFVQTARAPLSAATEEKPISDTKLMGG